jgi:hypothetical protein
MRTRSGIAPRGVLVSVRPAAQCRCVPVNSNVRSHMNACRLRSLLWACLLIVGSAFAEQPFTGEWEIDLRTPAERKAGAACGNANFKLTQTGGKVTGDHSMAAVGCGRLNEGGEGTVEGVARGNTAILVVTSGRNGQVVRGRAMREGSSLRWQVLEEVKPGEAEGDSGLILHRGILRRVRQ